MGPSLARPDVGDPGYFRGKARELVEQKLGLALRDSPGCLAIVGWEVRQENGGSSLGELASDRGAYSGSGRGTGDQRDTSLELSSVR